MKNVLASLMLVGLFACRGGPGGSAVPDAGAPAAHEADVDGPNRFAADRLWDDGRAEIDAYEAITRRYGILRPFTAYHIVVKEDFSRRQLVKADPGHDAADVGTVLKLNQVLQYQTGIYSYHQMASTFYDRTSMELLKFTLTSFEWCGNSFKEFTRRPDGVRLHVHTYWDNQAEATYELPASPDLILYDQLPLWIRSLPQTPGTSRSLRLVPGQIESKGARPEPIAALLRATTEESVRVPAGTFRALRWELQASERRPEAHGGRTGPAAARSGIAEAGSEIYWTARDFPYLLVAWSKPDGGSYRLKWTRRLAYWTLNHPGDESYLTGP